MTDKFDKPEFLQRFIEMYKQLPCLWEVKFKDYSNCNKKHEALSKLAELCKEICPKPKLQYVRNKIFNVRTVFKKELNKVRASQKSGAKNVYVPRLWYYKSLCFMTGQVDARASLCSLANPSPASADLPTSDIDLDICQDIPTTQ